MASGQSARHVLDDFRIADHSGVNDICVTAGSSFLISRPGCSAQWCSHDLNRCNPTAEGTETNLNHEVPIPRICASLVLSSYRAKSAR